MTYTVQQLSQLTGLTPRTLRYYDSIGLLRPRRQKENDYRLYSEDEVKRLCQILRYREMGLPLEEIGVLLEGAEEKALLQSHLDRLQKEQQRICRQMKKVSDALKGKEKEEMEFEKMKQQALRENEECYGVEIRERYGKEMVEESNCRFIGMSRENWEAARKAEVAYKEKLRQAMAEGDVAGEVAKEACRLHMEWLRFFWKKELCTPLAHMGLVQMYTQDERFRAYYEKIAPGCVDFLEQAVRAYYEK